MASKKVKEELERKFETGATRNPDVQPDYEGFFSSLAMRRYGEYMHKNRFRPSGEFRDSDNWQLGIPRPSYMKSMWRHLLDVWLEFRGYKSRDGIEDALCAIIFNAQGYLHEVLKEKEPK